MKRLLIGLCAVACVVLAVSVSWHGDEAEGRDNWIGRWGSPNLFAGSWSMPIPIFAPDGTFLHYSYHWLILTPLDPSGHRYNAVIKHGHCNYSYFGFLDPVATVNHVTDHVGIAVRTGPKSLRYTIVGHRSNCDDVGPFSDTPAIIEVSSGVWELESRDTMWGYGFNSIYSKDQDTNQDGIITEEDGDGVLPEPLMCFGLGGDVVLPDQPITRRITLQEPCTPPPIGAR